MSEVEVDLEAQEKRDWFHRKASVIAETHESAMTQKQKEEFDKAIEMVKGSQLVIPEQPLGKGFLRRQGWLLPQEDLEQLHWLEQLIHSYQFQLCMIILLCLDVVFVIGELVLEVEICRYNGNSSSSHRRSGGGGEPAWMTDLSTTLRWMSVAILFIFAVEIMLLMIVMGKRFWKNGFLILDFVVVVSSIVLDFTLHHSEESGLIVFLRFWRFVRIMHGIYMSEHEGSQHATELAKHSIDLLLSVNNRLRKALKELTRAQECGLDHLLEEMHKLPPSTNLNDVLTHPEHPLMLVFTKLKERDAEIYALQKDLKRFIAKDPEGLDVHYETYREHLGDEKDELQRLRQKVDAMADGPEKQAAMLEMKEKQAKIQKHASQVAAIEQLNGGEEPVPNKDHSDQV
eukprot:TRINITY_DN37917_c0_g1_i1.p1 TRINITY_DN37917_c0_g1~~TRINITY_DN37917_c0_g1_i1.p1  ORF type:complete len:400 (+),score=128.82 TRINITY_DN37917_c0_g1_i1:251-1450(+)